jgi:hypothetical protein
VRTVFVLGAGSSRPAGLPLGGELMTVLHDYLAADVMNAQREDNLRLWKEMFGKGIFREEDGAELNFTRLLLFVRSIYSSRRAGKAIDPEGAVNLNGAIPQLIDNYFQDEQEDLVRREPHRIDYLRRFMRRHVQRGDAIVTFNYDCLAEAALQMEGRWSLRRGFDVDLAEFYPDLANEPDLTDCEVIKLHGSAGWYRCVDPDAMYVAEPRPPRPEFEELLISRTLLNLLGYGDLQSREPDRKRAVRSDSIVLPTYLKTVDGHPLPFLWKEASERLREAGRVVVVGYSFPAADSVARTLFLSSIPGRTRVDLYWFGRDPDGVARLRHFFRQGGIELKDLALPIEELSEMETLPLG